MPARTDLANAVRMLAIDAVQQANSGHPGMPMGMADIAEVVWNDFYSHNPSDPQWPNRDRFVLSNGHGSMLQYALLHLTGYDLSIDELKNFRQLGSKTPGHPEYGMTPGVETTTGPLGQGIAAGVGMALAEKSLAAQFNQPAHAIVNHHTYVFCGDGCLMEGISHEACSLAGTLGLGKLIVFWDDNGISIDGKVQGWFSDDTPARFKAYGWQVIEGVDGHDADAIQAAVQAARGNSEQPTLICCRTTIGFGSPKLAGSEKSHGAPLGEEEIAAVRQELNWPHPAFDIPTEISEAWDARTAGTARQDAWQAQWNAYQAEFPAQAAELERRWAGKLPTGFAEQWAQAIEDFQQAGSKVATRKASQQCLEQLGQLMPELLGGSADLTGSNLTKWSGSVPISAESPAGNYVYYGVREFAMMAIMNGVATHGGFVPYGGTFLVFIDYARNAARLAALMKLRTIWVLTHDSIGLGEDGPTHQPIEHAAMLRATPGIHVWRPCDAVETAVAWQAALTYADGPSALLLTRQGVPTQPRSDTQSIAKGGYLLSAAEGEPQVLLLATGSEVELAMQAQAVLANEGVAANVVSLPCLEVFAQQTSDYQAAVLPPQIKARVVVEAGVSQGWHRYAGDYGRMVTIDRFGESAPATDVYQALGVTVENIVAAAKASLAATNEE